MSTERNLFKRQEIYWLRAKIRGVRFRESLRTGDLKIARRRRDERLEEIKAAKFFGDRRRTWFDAVAEWAAHAEDQIAKTTARRYAVSLEQVRPWLERYSVDEIDGQVIAQLVEGRRKSGTTAATIRRDLTAVSRVLEFAEAMHWREGNPTLSKRRILKERRDPIALPEPPDIETIIAAASPQFGALIRAAWLTGCRQNELVTARWKGFDAKKGTLAVIGKGNKRRTIKLSREARELLAGLPRALGCDLIFWKEGGEGFLQAASDFTHVRRAAIDKARQERRPLARFRFHDLRHLFAVEALRSGSQSIYELSKHLGHTSVKTTEIYLDFLTAEEAEAAKAARAEAAIAAERRRGK